MRRGFIMMELLVGLAVVTVVGSSAMVVFTGLMRETLALRADAIAVHEVRNAMARLEADPGQAPREGESVEAALSEAVRERYPNVHVRVIGKGDAGAGGLRRVSIVATVEREGRATQRTEVEMLVSKAGGEGGGR